MRTLLVALLLILGINDCLAQKVTKKQLWAAIPTSVRQHFEMEVCPDGSKYIFQKDDGNRELSALLVSAICKFHGKNTNEPDSQESSNGGSKSVMTWKLKKGIVMTWTYDQGNVWTQQLRREFGKVSYRSEIWIED